MKKSNSENHTISTHKRIGQVRIAFGMVWLIDAVFKFEPAFTNGFLSIVKGADAGEPKFLNPWFHFWYHLIGLNPKLFAILVLLIEVYLAVSLIAGITRRFTYLSGAILCLLIWAVGEGFGGPYVAGSTDIGAGIIYVFVFMMLFLTDTSKVAEYSLEPYFKHLLSKYDLSFVRNYKSPTKPHNS
jgi:uncharacterized membrane protein YphA (DoxX/SURF4 family)